MKKWIWLSGLALLAYAAYKVEETKKPKEGVLTFKSNITFKKDQRMSSGDNELPPITLEDVIDYSKTNMDEISFQVLPCANNPIQDRMFRNIYTEEVGTYEGKVYAKYNDECSTHMFKYKVV